MSQAVSPPALHQWLVKAGKTCQASERAHVGLQALPKRIPCASPPLRLACRLARPMYPSPSSQLDSPCLREFLFLAIAMLHAVSTPS